MKKQTAFCGHMGSVILLSTTPRTIKLSFSHDVSESVRAYLEKRIVTEIFENLAFCYEGGDTSCLESFFDE